MARRSCRLWFLVCARTIVLSAGHFSRCFHLPPCHNQGWRSWNSFYADIDDEKIRRQVDALVEPQDEDGTTLLSLGYREVGIDEGWEGCHPVHYPNGTPAVDSTRFPDLAGLVAYGHSKGVRMGHYLNGCGCNEKVEKRINYEGDVRQVIAWGFDGVKIDSCGAQKNMTLYYELFNATGTPITIENCHRASHRTTRTCTPALSAPRPLSLASKLPAGRLAPLQRVRTSPTAAIPARWGPAGARTTPSGRLATL